MSYKIKNIGFAICSIVIFCLSPIVANADAYWTRTADIHDGVLFPRAVELAIRFEKLAANNGILVKVTVPFSGNINRVRWSSSARDMKTIRLNLLKLQETQEFRRLYLKSSKVFINVVDEWWITPF